MMSARKLNIKCLAHNEGTSTQASDTAFLRNAGWLVRDSSPDSSFTGLAPQSTSRKPFQWQCRQRRGRRRLLELKSMLVNTNVTFRRRRRRRRRR